MPASTARLSLAPAVLALFLLAMGCVHHVHQHPTRVVTPVPPPWAPAHGHRHVHHDVTLVFDTELACYTVQGHRDAFYHHDHYYRWRSDRWERASRLRGPWHVVTLDHLPAGLRGWHTRRHATRLERDVRERHVEIDAARHERERARLKRANQRARERAAEARRLEREARERAERAREDQRRAEQERRLAERQREREQQERRVERRRERERKERAERQREREQEERRVERRREREREERAERQREQEQKRLAERQAERREEARRARELARGEAGVRERRAPLREEIAERRKRKVVSEKPEAGYAEPTAKEKESEDERRRRAKRRGVRKDLRAAPAEQASAPE